MEYKASLNTLGKIITGLVILFFIYMGYESISSFIKTPDDTTVLYPQIGAFVLLFLVIVFSYLFAPKAYKITDSELQVLRPVGNKKFKLSDISEVRFVENSLKTVGIRTFGVGGLFGYYGKFYFKDIGSVNMYATKLGNRILITMKDDKKIILTPNDLNFSSDLKEKMAST
ncbi:MAG: PH domain-containing protein [Chitinophagales bacterium]